jgi:hypothetical protein
MRRIKVLAVVGAAVAIAAALLVPGITASANPGTILRFETMSPVTGPYVGTANPIRGVPGGGFPWVIQSGSGTLQRDGHLKVRVRGLVLAGQAPVPPALQRTNPVPDFRAVVSCMSIGARGAETVVNVSTGTFAASKEGDSRIEARVGLPRPCIAPIVFVTSPTGAWFAATGS